MRRKSFFLCAVTYLLAVVFCDDTVTESGEMNSNPETENVRARTFPYYAAFCSRSLPAVIPNIRRGQRVPPNLMPETTLRFEFLAVLKLTPRRDERQAGMVYKRCDESRKQRIEKTCSARPETRYKQCNRASKPSQLLDPRGIYMGKCGYSNPGANFIPSRINGLKNESVHDDFGEFPYTAAMLNDHADFGEFPWMVAVLRRHGKKSWTQNDYFGGGSLINPMVVVTVAHLVLDPKRNIHLEANQIKIRAGEWQTDSEDGLLEHQDRNVAKIVVHERYVRESLFNNIALLFLEAPVDLEDAPHIGIGCLAPQLPPPGTICFSMGWGVKDFRKCDMFSSKLKKIKFLLLRNEKCEENLRDKRAIKIFNQSLLCAGGEDGTGNCDGDLGSPLVCPINSSGSRFAIYGMHASTLVSGINDVPELFVNVPTYFKWVGEQLAKERLHTKSYIDV